MSLWIRLCNHTYIHTYILYGDFTINTDADADDDVPVCVRNANETAVCEQHWLHPACKPCRKVGSVGGDHRKMGVAVVLSVFGLLTMFVTPILLRRYFRRGWNILITFLAALPFVITGRVFTSDIMLQRRRERPGLVPYWRVPGVECCMRAVVCCNKCLCIAQIACYRRLRKEDATGWRRWALLGDMERG